MERQMDEAREAYAARPLRQDRLSNPGEVNRGTDFFVIMDL
jgi:hypothetical protein